MRAYDFVIPIMIVKKLIKKGVKMSIAEKLEIVAKNVPKVYETGKKKEYNLFWDNYQKNGTKDNYQFAFAGKSWTNDTFRPKYDIIAKESAYGIFWNSSITGDLTKILKELGIKLDISCAAQYQYTFANSMFTRIGEVEFTGTNVLQSTFSSCNQLKTIDKLILKADGSNEFLSTFNSSTVLENITVEGVIGNDFNIRWSPLSTESVLSILKALSKNPVLANGKTVTFKSSLKAKIEADIYCSEQISLATAAGWTIAFL